jgi:hypothetical protein
MLSRVLDASAGPTSLPLLRIEKAPELTQDNSGATKKEIKKVF